MNRAPVLPALLAGLSLAAAGGLLAIGAEAQQQPTQAGWPQPVHNDPLLGYAVVNQNELRTGDGSSTYRWDAEGWYGDNLNSAWVKTEGNLDTGTSALDEAEAQLLYSRAVSTFFDLQAGVREDFAPGPARSWGAVGIEGLAPLYWNIGAFAFVSDSEHLGARLEGYYDLLLTQRLILQPQFELNVYSRNDPRREIGAGFSDLDTGLRLRYEIRRELAPYIGVTYENRYGHTAALTRGQGAPIEQVRLALGIRARL
ncbi:MAG TPA: copper resistance protein B [Steroidobacteraceae bacterium]|nr:copper resistance protein B [Steroidobacteraceae bacterium]